MEDESMSDVHENEEHGYVGEEEPPLLRTKERREHLAQCRTVIDHRVDSHTTAETCANG